jgi:hypothetical protein
VRARLPAAPFFTLRALKGKRLMQFAIEPIRSQQLPVGPEYVPEPLAIRMQDIIPEYEKTNPTMVKLDDMHRGLYANKQALISAFEDADTKQSGVLRKKDFTNALKAANQRCKLSIPRVLIDGMCEEAADMFGPEKDPRDPKDVIDYKAFVEALDEPPPKVLLSMEQAFEASSPAARMARTSRLLERPRAESDFTVLERLKAHIIQNDLR